MVTLMSIQPATNRAGEAVPSYSKNVHKGVQRETLTFPNDTEAYKYIKKHPGPAYVFNPKTKKAKVN